MTVVMAMVFVVGIVIGGLVMAAMLGAYIRRSFRNFM